MTNARSGTVGDTVRDAYKFWTHVNLRYGDTDRQGHVNNAVFCTLLESGRVDFLFDGEEAICGAGKNFVIAKISMDFLNEMNFPGIVDVGSCVLSIGNSSFVVGQALFKDEVCTCTSQSVIVMVDERTRRSTSLTPEVKERLQSLSRQAT